MKITFWGATDEVTGSMTFIEKNDRIGLVDAGLSQGKADSLERNRQPLYERASKIESIVITHAHLDHSGFLPRLVRNGFKGEIYCSQVTAELIKIILEDSAKLAKGVDDPFYELGDVSKTLRLLKPQKWNHEFEFLGAQATLVPAGHILGASSLTIEDKKKIVFSGDLGRKNDYLIPSPPNCPVADIVIMESTYGGKLRSGNTHEELLALLKSVKDGERVCLVASFALARGQALITELEEIFDEHPDLRVPLYFDSPMMKAVNEIYKKHHDLTLRRREVVESLKEVESIDFVKQWEWLKHKKGPFIVISSSGMVSGGRIFRHLKNWQNDTNAVLFLPGYQGENTGGRALKEGQGVIFDTSGEPIFWSGEVRSSDAFSSHADQNELYEWVQNSGASAIYLIHGEQQSKEIFKERLQKITENVIIPKRADTIDLGN